VNNHLSSTSRNEAYWDEITDVYQEATQISTERFHLGPLIPSAESLQLLPDSLSGLRCLELGCGAAQNSLVLSKAGAQCTAVDVSPKQLEIGRTLLAAEIEAQTVTADSLRLLQAGLDDFPIEPESWDFIHSTYALPFIDNPAALLKRVADGLVSGGTCLLSVGHPLFAMEPLELEEGEQGVFVPDYFEPYRDTRALDSGAWTRAEYLPVETVCRWVTDAGLCIDRLLEPRPVPDLDVGDPRLAEIPYWSEDWLEQADRLEKIPVVLVIRARKLI